MREPEGLAFKAYEIEELADVYFFRPLGMTNTVALDVYFTGFAIQ